MIRNFIRAFTTRMGELGTNLRAVAARAGNDARDILRRTLHPLAGGPFPRRRLAAITFSAQERVDTSKKLVKYLVPFWKRIGQGAIIAGGFTGTEYAMKAIISAASNMAEGGQGETLLSDENLADIIASPAFKKIMKDQHNEDERKAKDDFKRMENEHHEHEKLLEQMEMEFEKEKQKITERELVIREMKRYREEKRIKEEEQRKEEEEYREYKKLAAKRKQTLEESKLEKETELEAAKKKPKIKKVTFLDETLEEQKKTKETKEKEAVQKANKEADEKEAAEKANKLYHYLTQKGKEADEKEATEKASELYRYLTQKGKEADEKEAEEKANELYRYLTQKGKEADEKEAAEKANDLYLYLNKKEKEANEKENKEAQVEKEQKKEKKDNWFRDHYAKKQENQDEKNVQQDVAALKMIKEEKKNRNIIKVVEIEKSEEIRIILIVFGLIIGIFVVLTSIATCIIIKSQKNKIGFV